MFKTYQEFQQFVKEKDIKMVDFKEVDLAGRWHHLTIPVGRFDEGLLEKGIGFDGSSYGFLTVEKSDMVFIPDLTSAFVDPMVKAPTVTMIGDVYRITDEGLLRFESDPRQIAQKAEEFLTSTGIADMCLFGPEFEFYVLDNVEYRNQGNHIEVHLDSAQAEWNTIHSPYDGAANNLGCKVPGHGGYHVDIPHDVSFDMRNEMVLELEENGVPVKYHHSENGGPGQVEIEVNFATLKEIGDRTQKIKYFVRNMARKHGKTVTFMPKPFIGECGNGMHVHMHMFKDKKPVFYDEKGYSGLSDVALSAICGILKHSPALLAFTNPTTNSYKRLVPGYEAPVTICFATSNRSSVIRIPGYARAPMEKRFEFRPADAMANPYLAYAALLMAAIDGIQKGLKPGPEFGPYDKNMYHLTEEEKKVVKSLPKSLEEAADALEKDSGFLTNGGVFSQEIIANQLRSIRKDAEEVNVVPHPIEFQKYYDR